MWIPSVCRSSLLPQHLNRCSVWLRISASFRRQTRLEPRHIFSGGRVMRRFTFIAFSMRKVLTHPVFLWRHGCHTRPRIAGSSGKAIYWLKFSTIISSQIINGEWKRHLYLQRVIPATSILQRDATFALFGIWFFSNRSAHLKHFTCRKETRKFLYNLRSAKQKSNALE